ncbi:MAG: hypothetical protein AAF655_10070 [Bacteroidota bacterium]
MKTFFRIVAYVLLSICVECMSSYEEYSQGPEIVPTKASLNSPFPTDSLDHALKTGILIKYIAHPDRLH